ncbi:hypothetical protein [Zhongshania sp.]
MPVTELLDTKLVFSAKPIPNPVRIFTADTLPFFARALSYTLMFSTEQ